MGWIAIASWRRTKVNEAELKKLQDQSPHRRRRAAVRAEETS
jgi:hypothetical protein